MNKLLTIIAIMTLCIRLYADFNDNDGNTLRLTGYASYQFGQVLSGTYKEENDINHYWLQKVFANLGFYKSVGDRFSFAASMELLYQSSFNQANTFPETERYIPVINIDQARGDLVILDKEDVITLSATVGYFHYRYNNDVTNLGNNLFKSYCYPTAIVQPEFDFPFSRLCGLDFNVAALKNKISFDFLFTTHLFFYPTGDFSLTGILGGEPFRGIKLNAGLQLDRLLSTNPKMTTPKDRARKVDPATATPENPGGDTTFYTYAGTKVMGTLNLDIKKIVMGDAYSTLFGENDAKMWIEMDILGLKDYYYYYENIAERIPVAFGFMLPTFKVLNTLAIEFEYLPLRYPNSIKRPMFSNVPYPEIQESNYNPADYDHDNWKWSVYAKKSFNDLSIIGLIGRDHLQLWSLRDVERVYSDNLSQTRNMYYQIKFMYSF